MNEKIYIFPWDLDDPVKHHKAPCIMYIRSMEMHSDGATLQEIIIGATNKRSFFYNEDGTEYVRYESGNMPYLYIKDTADKFYFLKQLPAIKTIRT